MVSSRHPEVLKPLPLSGQGCGDRGRLAPRMAPSEVMSDVPHAPLLGSETVPAAHTPEGVYHEQTAHTLEEPAAAGPLHEHSAAPRTRWLPQAGALRALRGLGRIFAHTHASSLPRPLALRYLKH